MYAVLFSLLAAVPGPADTAADLAAARSAFAAGKSEEALKLAAQAIAAAPMDVRPRLFRGSLHEALRKYPEALADLTEALRLDPRSVDALNTRGSVYFKLGKVKESALDFDRAVELRPEEGPGHWRRGISYYYAGRFEEGRKQFEGYEAVDTNDVENAVWHYLCTARAASPEEARRKLLKIGNDRRVPMMQVYELFAGRMKPDEVLRTAEAGEVTKEERRKRLFYAHLYLGLYQETRGNRAKAREHLELAAGEYRIGHYMGEVARVHAEMLRSAVRSP